MPDTPSVFDSLVALMVRRNLRGQTRLLTLVKQHLPYFLIRARSKHGLLFNLNPEDYIDRLVLKTGYYEEEVLASILQHVGDDGVLWDIGANIGLHAVSVKHQRPNVQVVCFEPSPFTFSRLVLNVNLNRSNIILMNVGLGSSPGYARLSLTISGNSGLTSFKPSNEYTYDHSVLCYCDSAIDLVKRGVVPKPTVLKIDVEGFELEVLSGFGELLNDQSIRAIIFESPTDYLDHSERYPTYRLLQQAGFDISPLQPTDLDKNSVPTNFLARR